MVNFVFYNHDFGYNIDKSNWGATLRSWETIERNIIWDSGKRSHMSYFKKKGKRFIKGYKALGGGAFENGSLHHISEPAYQEHSQQIRKLPQGCWLWITLLLPEDWKPWALLPSAPNSALSQVDLSLECRSHLSLALRKQRSFRSMLESWVYVLGKHLNVRRWPAGLEQPQITTDHSRLWGRE